MQDSLDVNHTAAHRILPALLALAAVLTGIFLAGEARAGDFDYAGRTGIVYLDRDGAPLLEVPVGPEGRRPLEPGVTVTVVIFGAAPGDEQRLVQASVARGPMQNARPERRIYLPGSGEPPPTDRYALAGLDGSGIAGTVGLGIAGADGRCRISGGAAQCDLEPDGTPQSFRLCASSEGLHLSIWSGAVLEGERRWRLYYYLGYDIAPSCTARDYAE